METSDIRAYAHQLPFSAQKARQILGLVRGKDVNKALDALKFNTRGAAKPIRKLIASAAANAEENMGISRDDLFVYRVFADEGPTRKWRRFGARGRFKPLLRRSAHITVILREKQA